MLRLSENRAEKFAQALDTLRDPEAAFSADMIYSLSDLSASELAAFNTVWDDMAVERRRDLIKRLVETAEMNFEFDFSAIIHPALSDADEGVRVAAVDGVLEDCPLTIIERLLHQAQNDPISAVRAAAARVLGQFVLAGELGKLPHDLNLRLQDTVLALHNNPNEALDVRRRALEALSNCGHDSINDLIREAYYADELPMRVSAVFAMGRSYDSVWTPQVLAELDSEQPELRYEATRAAGELELRKALPRLTELAFEDDREIQEMAIWSLGEIGGSNARQVLNQLASLADETADDELADAVMEAQAAANLVGEDVLPLFDFSEYEDDDFFGEDDDPDEDL
ncbi:MAG: HEAT repeat domain-containing protein [Chloroflexi bacterium]|nr:HEAT repeat domain-containing protein [Chloroflexota bacterium]